MTTFIFDPTDREGNALLLVCCELKNGRKALNQPQCVRRNLLQLERRGLAEYNTRRETWRLTSEGCRLSKGLLAAVHKAQRQGTL